MIYASDLPDTIPVFPLAGTLMLPRTRLPLHIFEPRYLAMTLDSLAHGRMLGMIQGDPSKPRGERGSSVVLRGENVARTPAHFRTKRGQCFN